MDTEPIAVALKFGFLIVLYLFLLWVARSALKEVRTTSMPAPEATGFHAIGPGGREPGTDASLVVLKGGGLEPGERFDLFGGLDDRPLDRGRRPHRGPLRLRHPRAIVLALRWLLRRGHGLDQRHLPRTTSSSRAESLLSDLDVVRIGDTEFRFELEVPA